MKDLSHAVKEINVPDIVQEKAQNAFTQIQEESRMSKNSNVRRRVFMSPALAAAAIVAVVLIGGGVAWAASGGLAGFLSKFMPEEEVNARLDTPSENEIEINQSEEYWYDGATLYFSATAPQKVIDAGNMRVVWSDHADVNGTDCQLSADGDWDENTETYTGHYICYVDLSNADTSSGHVSLVTHLKLNQYKIVPELLTTQENNEVETIAEQELRFDFEKPNDSRQLREDNLPVEGGVADISVTVAPSMFNVKIVYRLKDTSKSIKDIVKYRITDSSGNSTTEWVYGIDFDDNCVTIFMTDLEGLDPNAKSYTFEPLCFQLDSEGERVPDAFDPLGWGGFTVEFK